MRNSVLDNNSLYLLVYRFFCDGEIIGNKLKKKNHIIEKYTNVFIKVRSSNYLSRIYLNFNTRVSYKTEKYISFMKGRYFHLKVIPYGPKFINIYSKFFFLFSELRMRFISNYSYKYDNIYTDRVLESSNNYNLYTNRYIEATYEYCIMKNYTYQYRKMYLFSDDLSLTLLLKKNYSSIFNLYSSIPSTMSNILLYIQRKYKALFSISNTNQFQRYIFINKFFENILLSNNIQMLLKRILDVKYIDFDGYSMYLNYQYYHYLDDKKNKKEGSYVSKKIVQIDDKYLGLPNLNIIYYSVWYMLLHSFLYKYQYSLHGHSSLLSWFIHIESFTPLHEKLIKEFNDFDNEEKDLLNFPGDELWFNKDIFNFVNNNNKHWKNFRKICVYTKYEEYFFFVYRLFYSTSLYQHQNLKGIYNLYKYGYFGFRSKVFIRYIKLRKQLAYLCIIKKLSYRRLKFSVFSNYKSLEYWAEVSEKANFGIGSSMFINNFFNCLIGNQILFDNRYTVERKLYYKRHVPINQLHTEYLGYLKGKKNIKYYRSKKYIRDNIRNLLNYRYKIERAFRDTRDFFNPNIDLGIITSSINNMYVTTRANYLFNIFKYSISPFGDLVHTDVQGSRCLNAINLPINLYFWNDIMLFDSIFSQKNREFNSHIFNYYKCNVTSLYYNSRFYDELFNNSYYGLFDYSIILGKIEYGTVGLLKGLMSYVLRSVSYFIHSGVIFKHFKYFQNLSNFNSDLTNSSYLNFISSSKDLLFNNMWIYSLIKVELLLSYRIYLTKYLISNFIFKRNIKKYNYNNTLSLTLYKYKIKNYINYISNSPICNERRIFHMNKYFIKRYKQYLRCILILDQWIKYWNLFFGNDNIISIKNINFVNIVKIINTVVITDESEEENELSTYYYNCIYNSRQFFNFYGSNIWFYKNIPSFIRNEYYSQIYSTINRLEVSIYDSIYYNNNIYNYLIYRLIILTDNIVVILKYYITVFGKLFSNLFFISFYNAYIDQMRYVYQLLLIYNSFIGECNFTYNSSTVVFKISNIIRSRYISEYINISLSIRKYFRKYIKISRRASYKLKINFINRKGKRMAIYMKSLNKLSNLHLEKFFNIYLFYNIGKVIKFKSKVLYSLSCLVRKSLCNNVFIYLVNSGRLLQIYNNHIINFINSKIISMTNNRDYNTINSSTILRYFDFYSKSKYLLEKSLLRINYVEKSEYFTYADYLAMYEPGSLQVSGDNLYVWLSLHRIVKVDTRYYYSKFWYRYVPEDILNIQRYRRFQQEIRRLISNKKKLRSGIIYRRLLLFKLVPGELKDWNKLHVKRPYIREQFEDRVRFFYILKYKYKISRKKLLKALYSRFSSPYSLYRAYHLLYFRLDNILFKLNFIPSFTYLRDNWVTHFWNISINTVSDTSLIQRSLKIGDIFYIKDNLHLCAIKNRLEFHYEANFYMIYLLWIRLNGREGLPTYASLPSQYIHNYILKSYIWYWYKIFKNLNYYVFNKVRYDYIETKIKVYGFWAHNFLLYKQFKNYMVINSMDNYVRWYSSCMSGFVYREPIGFLNGLHYSSYYRSESGSYGGHLKFTSTYK